MENLVFCLNATIPIFLTLLLGLFFRKIGLFDDAFVSRLNKFVFNAALPALLFLDIAKSDFSSVWNTKFVLFCFFVTLISIGISTGLSYLLKPRNIQGEFIQASYRSSAAILGIAIIQNLYGNAGMAPLMIIGSVPLYNVMAVTTLSLFAPGYRKTDQNSERYCDQSYHPGYSHRHHMVTASSAHADDTGYRSKQSWKNRYSSWPDGYGRCTEIRQGIRKAEATDRMYLSEACGI